MWASSLAKNRRNLPLLLSFVNQRCSLPFLSSPISSHFWNWGVSKAVWHGWEVCCGKKKKSTVCRNRQAHSWLPLEIRFVPAWWMLTCLKGKLLDVGGWPVFTFTFLVAKRRQRTHTPWHLHLLKVFKGESVERGLNQGLWKAAASKWTVLA